MVSLRKDGYLTTQAVSENNLDDSIVYDTMAVSVECLLPCSSYEIVVAEQQIGITVSAELPLRVVGFKHVPQSRDGPPRPGSAECTGRLHIGDVITSVNGQEIGGLPRSEALAAISRERPVVLGFTVGSSMPEADSLTKWYDE